MAIFKQDAAAAAQKAAERERREQERAERAVSASPWGSARAAYKRGDQIFQITFDVMAVETDVVPGSDEYSEGFSCNSSEVLNAIVAEGWSLHCMSTSVVNVGQESGARITSAGRQVGVQGTLFGTYVFTRDQSAD